MADIKNFYRNKKILVTGHTGFKGSWLHFILKNFGAKVYSYSLKPLTVPSNYDLLKLNKSKKEAHGNIKNYNRLKKYINKIEPEIIFHLAAQSLVKKSYEYPKNTFSTNCIKQCYSGYINEDEKVKAVLIITSDKCYKNKEKNGYRENDELRDRPYSASKLQQKTYSMLI